MPTPFPGMDPYLERPNLWSGVHNRLIIALADLLSPLLRPRYFVAVQERAYLDEPGSVGFVNVPDAAVIGPYAAAPVQVRGQTAVAPAPLTIDLPMPVRVRETYLEIQEIGDDAAPRTAFNGEPTADRVVTLLEILSPWNKRPGKGRREYLYKREKILNSATNLVEIDLLRAGERMNTVASLHYDYSILISRAATRPRAALYAFTVRQPIPTFHLPLQPEDEEPLVDTNALLHALYDRAGYDLRINYRTEPIPPLGQDDEAWADTLLRNASLR
ncbi:MAG: DUF4058 family protein [Caldilineaceae bacterium]